MGSGTLCAVQYLILIYSSERSRESWASLALDDRSRHLDGYQALNEELKRTGELIVAEALADPTLAISVFGTDGHATFAKDGPVLHDGVQVIGFFLVDCDGPERAVEIAGHVPEAAAGLVEVRPTMDLSGFLGEHEHGPAHGRRSGAA